jgi:hypothetical protein
MRALQSIRAVRAIAFRRAPAQAKKGRSSVAVYAGDTPTNNSAQRGLRWERFASLNRTPPPTATVAEAHERGTLGFGFSAGGLLFPYYVGVVKALHDLGILGPNVPVAGASAGSLIAACYKSGLHADDILAATLLLARDCRTGGTRFRLQSVLEATMREVLPADAHVLCSGQAFIAVTQVYPQFQPVLVSEFTSREHLISALLTSCHIPWYFNGSLTTQYDGAHYFDGGLTQFIPTPPMSEHAVQVCCFPAKQMLSFPGIQIAPDKYGEWPHDLSRMLGWAFEPAEEELLLSFVEKGAKDATAWATASGLVPVLPVLPVVGEEAARAVGEVGTRGATHMF